MARKSQRGRGGPPSPRLGPNIELHEASGTGERREQKPSSDPKLIIKTLEELADPPARLARGIVDSLTKIEKISSARQQVFIEQTITSTLDRLQMFYRTIDFMERSHKVKELLKSRDTEINNSPASAAEQPVDTVALEGRSFAERLEYYRKAASLSQRALSAKAGLEQSHVSQLERSLAEPRLHTLINLADALGIDPCALIPKGRGRG